MKNIFIYVVVGIISFFSYASSVYGISNIKVSNYSLSPLFDSKIFVYNIYVEEDISELNIKVNTEEDDKEVFYEEVVKLNDNFTEAKIVVLKNNNNSLQYTLRIFKNYKKDNDFTSASLIDLSVEGYEIDFSPNIFNYTINIEESVNFLKINYEALSDLSYVVISGNNSLSDNDNLIVVTVTSQDKKNKTIYTIKANKIKTVFNNTENEEKNIFNRTELTDKENEIIIIVIISIAFILIMFTLFLLFFTGDRKSSTKNKKDTSHDTPQK